MPTDRHADLHHVLRSHLAVIRGWEQLLTRESHKPMPDMARLTRYAANLDAGITALDEAITQHLDPEVMPGTPA